jgi:hypothetical protein
MNEESKIEETSIDLKVSEYAKQAVECLKNGDAKAFSMVRNYFSLVTAKLKLFDISREDEVTYDLIIRRADQMLPLRNEIINLIATIAEFQEDSRIYKKLHSFFENLLPYFSFRNETESNDRLAADHFILFGSELFIYATAALLKHRKFEQLNELTNQGYFIPRWRYNSLRQFISFCKFNQTTETLIGHYRRKNIRKEDSKTRYFKDRMFEEEFNYDELAQADFVLHLISLLDLRIKKELYSDIWHPQLQAASYPFEIFTRSQSAWFFEKFTKCLRSATKDDLIEFFKAYKENQFGDVLYYLNLNWERIMALKTIATRA